MDAFEQQIAELQRRRQVGAQGAGFNAPQGKMVSGRYVKANPLEYLAEALRGAGQSRDSVMAGEEMGALQDKRPKAIADALRGFQSELNPSQAGTGGTGMVNDALPPEMRIGAQPQITRQPNMQAAFGHLMNSNIGSLQSAGMTGMLSNAQEQAKQAQAQALQQRQMQILKTAKTPQEALAAGVPFEAVKNFYESPNIGREEIKYVDSNGTLIPTTKYGKAEGVPSIGPSGNPFKDLLVAGPDGKPMVNQPMFNAKNSLAKSGATRVDVDARNYNTQESEQSKAYGKTLGEMRGAITQSGFDAPRKLAQIDRMQALIGGMDSGGKAAPVLADIASFANSLGIKIDPKLGAKEAAEALAMKMASELKQPGTGPMTDKDFDNFVKQVPGLSKTPSGRQQIMTTMKAALQRDLEASKFMREYAKANNGAIDDNFYDAMADFYVKNPVVTPALPETNARGEAMPKGFRVIP